MNPDDHPFTGLDGALASERTSKPRASGRTMMIDWGIPRQHQRDLTDMSADYVDLAKIAVGLSRLWSHDLLKQKIDQYRSRDIEPFPGGQYLEYAEVHGKLDRYLPACIEAGYRWIEVSDNIAPVSVQWKQKLITEAVEDSVEQAPDEMIAGSNGSGLDKIAADAGGDVAPEQHPVESSDEAATA